MKKTMLLVSALLAGNAYSTELPLSIKAEVQDAVWAESWWMPRHLNKISNKDQRDTIDLLFIGDSITHAWEDKGRDIWQQYYQSRHAFNLGFSGDRTEHVLWRLQNGAIDGLSPKLVVLLIGTNNTGHRLEAAEDTALGIRHILDLLDHKLPHSKILLLGVLPRGEKPNDPMRIINRNINEIIQHFDDGKKIHYLNINESFLNAKGEISTDVMSDFLHPNPDQYKVWAEAIEPTVKKLLEE